MEALDSAGIYVLLDLATPSDNGAISSSSPSWNVGLVSAFLDTVDAFGSFSNGAYNLPPSLLFSSLLFSLAFYVETEANPGESAGCVLSLDC